jgi:flagellar M-ring protein FliF
MEQFRQLLAGFSTKQKASIAIAALLTVLGIFSFTRSRHEDDFRPLYTSMAMEDASGVVQKLRETGVEYRLSENGSAVLVPSAKLAESRLALAAAGLPKTGRIGFELFDKTSFGTTEFVEHINYKRALEGELERSVMSLAEVEQARVHLTLPKDSVFIEQQQPAKASVLLKLRLGAQLSAQNVLAVTNLVASAAEGLSPDAVTVLDMDGRLLSRPKHAGANDGALISSETLEMRHQIESELVAKISATLEPVIGANKFRVGASVDCDLTSGEQQEETFDPGHSVMTSSQKTEDSSERTASTGIPGTASNLPNPPARPANGSGGLSRRTENITFQSSRLVRHTRIPQGVVKRMSLSVLLDQTLRWEGEGAAKRKVLMPPTPETLKTIKDLVAASTGFSTERGDQLIVETLPFESSLNAEPLLKPTPPAPAAAPPKPEPKWPETLRKRSLPIGLGLVLLLFLAGGLIARLRRKKNIVEVEVPGLLVAPGAPSPGYAVAENREVQAQLPAAEGAAPIGVVLERARQITEHDVSVAANVIRSWLQERRA